MNSSRAIISQSQWCKVQGSLKSHAYDKEAYEYSISQRYLTRKKQSEGTVTSSHESIYLVKLEGLLRDAQTVQELAGLDDIPKTERNDDSSTSFCVVSGSSRDKITKALLQKGGQLFEPVFLPVKRAAKSLSPDSIYPAFGIDTTLPQFRSDSSKQSRPSPQQDDYPVSYFFYGTLTDKERLGKMFSCEPEAIWLRAARVSGARLTTWADKYKSLLSA